MDTIILILLIHSLIACVNYPVLLSYLETEEGIFLNHVLTPKAMATTISLFPLLNLIVLFMVLDIRRLQRKRDKRLRKARRDMYLNMAQRMEILKKAVPHELHKGFDEAISSLRQEAENAYKKKES